MKNYTGAIILIIIGIVFQLDIFLMIGIFSHMLLEIIGLRY